MEATREKDNWQKHIAADYGKAKDGKHKKLTGFLFVAGYPKKRADPNDIGRWTAKFRALGIDEQRIHILVGMGLVRELAQPQYAGTRLTILGIRDCPPHFKMLGEHTTANEREYLFEPSAQDYKLGLVHRPKLADAVEAQLRERDWVLVRGRGAAGKTVMVNLIAAGADYRSLPIYYLDLAGCAEREEDIRGSVQNELIEFGGNGILFILDNIHRDDVFANDLFHCWKKTACGTGTRLLLVGRETGKRVGSLLNHIPDLPPLILYAGSNELLGVYRRIMFADYAAPGGDPPAVEVESWLKSFGGKAKDGNSSADLIAFGAAAMRRKNFLFNKERTLTASDAVEEMRVHYYQRRNDETCCGSLRFLKTIRFLTRRWPTRWLASRTASIKESFLNPCMGMPGTYATALCIRRWGGCSGPQRTLRWIGPKNVARLFARPQPSERGLREPRGWRKTNVWQSRYYRPCRQAIGSKHSPISDSLSRS